MEKFIPYEKLSKKKRRELDARRRNVWQINPVTRKPADSRAYNRKKAQKRTYDADPVPYIFAFRSFPALSFSSGFWQDKASYRQETRGAGRGRRVLPQGRPLQVRNAVVMQPGAPGPAFRVWQEFCALTENVWGLYRLFRGHFKRWRRTDIRKSVYSRFFSIV